MHLIRVNALCAFTPNNNNNQYKNNGCPLHSVLGPLNTEL